MTLLNEIRGHALGACTFALATGFVVYYFDLLPGLEYVVAGLAVLLLVGRPVFRVLPGRFRAHPPTIPVNMPDQLKLAESLTTAGGVALVAVIACLTTDPLRSADADYERAIVVMVVLSAVFLFLCRGFARDALSVLCRTPDDGSPERESPARCALAFADISIAMMWFTAILVVLAVLRLH